MMYWRISFLLLGTLAAAQSAIREVVAAGKKEGAYENLRGISILGVAPDNSIWTLQYEPQFTYWSIKQTNRKSKKLPTATLVEDEGRDLILNSLGDDGELNRTYLHNGKEYWTERERGNLVSAPQAAYWPLSNPELVGLGRDGAFWRWTSGDNEGEKGWTDLGGAFSSDPAVIADKANLKFHVYGIAKENSKLVHKQLLYEDDTWSKTWETLSDGPFKGGIATTYHPYDGQYDKAFHLWTLDSKGALLHKTFDGTKYSDWENLGGKFEKTPSAIHMVSDRIDVVGRNPETGEYSHKAYHKNKFQWSEKWNDIKGISYTSEPVLVFSDKGTKTSHLYIIGITKDGTINAHYMNKDFQKPAPIDDKNYPIQQLGNVDDPYGEKESAGWDDL